MAGMGPAPKPSEQQRRRGRNLADRASTRLPADGRNGKAPIWPLGKPSQREAELWKRLWKTPQAVAWEQLGWYDVVARYARILAAAERRNAKAAHLIEARQLEDRLGLTPMSMLRLKWTIEEDVVGAIAGQVLDIRDRLKAVE